MMAGTIAQLSSGESSERWIVATRWVSLLALGFVAERTIDVFGAPLNFTLLCVAAIVVSSARFSATPSCAGWGVRHHAAALGRSRFDRK